MRHRRSVPLALAMVAVTCDSPVTPARCGAPTTITTYSQGYRVERNICIESPDAGPPYTTRSSNTDVATATSSGTRLFVTGGNTGDATITVAAGQAGTVTYPVVTLDPWTLESFECTVGEAGPTDGFPEGSYPYNYAVEGKVEVALAELFLFVYVDDYRLGPLHTIKDLAEGQEFGLYVGGAMSRAGRDIDLNDYECTVGAEWVYAP